MARNPDIEKFCKNCGAKIERKNTNGRIEEYARYKDREYCSHPCYLAMRKKKAAAVPPPPEPTKAEMAARFAGELEAAQLIEELTPLEFMLREMNRVTNSLTYRKEMAALAAPYCHQKLDAKATGKTKKEERAEAAGKVATGTRFGQTPAPKVVRRIG